MSIERNFPYLPHTDFERSAMLDTIGVKNFEELVAHVPESIRVKELNLASSLSEMELVERIEELASKNKPASAQANFLGGGSYRRFTPQVVQAIISRSEFATAYTPYQPEVSQGSLQAIYEFQTAVCLLTGMEVANASMYDGPTACAEAALMASRLTGRKNIVIATSVNPEYQEVVKTYVHSCGLELALVASGKGTLESAHLNLNETEAALIIQYPNFFGVLEDVEALIAEAHKKGVLVIVVTDPIALGLLEPPLGADIVVGDAQPCGNNLSFGGPSAGYLATKMEFVRQMPGRICGMTKDNRGQDAFTLTLQTREQHIRRSRATSNICTNQALNALAMLVYLSVLGPKGLATIAEISVRRAHHLADLLCAIPGVKLAFDKPFFNEFVIQSELPPKQVLNVLKEQGILAGIDLSRQYPALKNAILVCVTETTSVSQLVQYQKALSELVGQKACMTVSANSTSASSK